MKKILRVSHISQLFFKKMYSKNKKITKNQIKTVAHSKKVSLWSVSFPGHRTEFIVEILEQMRSAVFKDLVWRIQNKCLLEEHLFILRGAAPRIRVKGGLSFLHIKYRRVRSQQLHMV